MKFGQSVCINTVEIELTRVSEIRLNWSTLASSKFISNSNFPFIMRECSIKTFTIKSERFAKTLLRLYEILLILF